MSSKDIDTSPNEISLTSKPTTTTTTKNTLEDDQNIIRSMWETPSIYQYLSFFKQPLGLKMISSDELESLLLNPKNYTRLVADIFISIIRDLLPQTKQRTINYNNWEHFLKVELNKENNYFDCFEENPFQEDEQFSSIDLKNRVLLLKSVCDWSLSKSNTILNHVKQFVTEPDTLRNLPLGILNNQKEFYWYFGDYRLYKETVNNPNNRRKKDSKEQQNSKWEIICSTTEEWEELIETYESYGNDEKETDEKILYANLKDVLPQVTSKLSAAKRKKTMFQTAQSNISATSITEPRQWRSTRLLALDLRKKEQEDLMNIQRQQIEQYENDPYSRRSTRARTNLYYDDDGVLTYKLGNNGDDDDGDMIGGGKSSENKKRGRGDGNQLNVQVHYSRSGRRVITDEYGRPKAYNTLNDEEKNYVDKILNEEDNFNIDQDNQDSQNNQDDQNVQDNDNNNNNNNNNNTIPTTSNSTTTTSTSNSIEDEKQKLQNQLQQLQQQLQKEQQLQIQKQDINNKQQQQESIASNSSQLESKDSIEKMNIDNSNNNNNNSNNNSNNSNTTHNNNSNSTNNNTTNNTNNSKSNNNNNDDINNNNNKSNNNNNNNI